MTEDRSLVRDLVVGAQNLKNRTLTVWVNDLDRIDSCTYRGALYDRSGILENVFFHLENGVNCQKLENGINYSFLIEKAKFSNERYHLYVSSIRQNVNSLAENVKKYTDYANCHGKEADFNRVVCLRSSKLQRILRTKSRIKEIVENILKNNDFCYVETPFVTRSIYEYTDNDFYVISALRPGEVSHLVQSPQLYKQMLMASGIERYYQVTRNFRAEKGDKTHVQEFTQIDLELVEDSREKIMAIMEKIIAEIFFELYGVRVFLPFAHRKVPSKLNLENFEKGILEFEWGC
ncbi:MAG: hypothetical protein LBI29_02775 [Rickettsiales bacterium]|nr:hypothetical protein [Rickettsiales bacterium]